MLGSGVRGDWTLEAGHVVMTNVGRYTLFAPENMSVLTFDAEQEGWTVEAFTRGRLGADMDFDIQARFEEIDIAMDFRDAQDARSLLDTLGYLTGPCTMISDRVMALDRFNNTTWAMNIGTNGASVGTGVFHIDGTYELGGATHYWQISRGFLTLDGGSRLMHYNESERRFYSNDVFNNGSAQYRWSLVPTN